MADRKNGNIVVATLGLMLIGLGLLFLLAQVLGFSLVGYVWPLFIVVPGLLCFAGLIAGGRRAAGLAVPGALLTTLGGILLLQSLTGYYESWAYVWPLLPAAVGAGIAIIGLLHGNRTTLLVGVVLVVVNLLIFLVAGTLYELMPQADRQLGRLLGWRGIGGLLARMWPLWIVFVGLVLFGVMLIGGKETAPMAVPAGVVTGVGTLLLFQSLFEAYWTWAYAWALIPVMVGASLVIGGLWAGKRDQVRSGKGLMLAGVLLFAVFGAFFELVLNIGGLRDGMLGGIVWSVLLIGAGGVLLVRQLLRRPVRA